MNLYDFTVKDIDGNDVPLSKYKGKTVLVVNSATGCIFTPQYKDLEALYESMKGRDFEILDFPCNQFKGEAPGTSQEIRDFCALKYGVKYTQFAKIDVLGENADPLFNWLQENTQFLGFGIGFASAKLRQHCGRLKILRDYNAGQIRWNFTKFLINNEGEIVERYEPPEPIEIIKEDVNRIINGEDISVKGYLRRKEKKINSKTTKRIARARQKNTFAFFGIGFVWSSMFAMGVLYAAGIAFENLDLPAIFIASAIGALLVSFAFNAFSRMSERQLDKICMALEQASAGNLNYRLREDTNKIYIRPFKDYNKMAENLKAVQLKMEAAIEDAQNANQAKSNFLSNMSHEMRTPLNAVLGMDEMIIRETGEEQIKQYALDIKSAGRSLLSLINDILDLSKVEAGKMEIIPVEYDLSSVINDLVNMVAEKAQSKGLKLIVDVDKDMPHIFVGDEVRLKQVCLNILNNAVKYTDDGSITMTFGYTHVDGQPAITYSVKDTGQGIKEEDRVRLFEPFARIEEKKNRNVEGTGLGMSITKNLLELMDSRLLVESTYGVGSTFSFVVKQELVKDEPIGDFIESYKKAIANEKHYTESFRAPEAKLLVVDDVEMNLTVVKSFLKRTLVQIDTATGGCEALSMAESKKYDLIFVDHMMPDMDGFETLKHLREEDGANKATPVVVLTANAVSGAREQYMEAGFDEYLTKPIESAKLEMIIRKLLPENLVELVDEELSNETEDNPVIGKLRETGYVDVDAGIASTGGSDAYVSVVKNFVNTAATRAEAIHNYFMHKDYKNYTIQVHALKSSARFVGDMALSKLAEEMESCGNSLKTDIIEEKTPILLENYEKLAGNLASLIEDKTDKPLIEKDMLLDAIQMLYEAVEAFDMDTADSIMGSMDEYKMPDDFAATYDKIKVYMSEVERDAIMELIDNYKKD